MSNEIEELRKRLETVEHNVRWMASALCTTTYNVLLATYTGEEKKSYVGRWKKKVDAVAKDIQNAPTFEEAMKLVTSFCVEIGQYRKATKVDTADKAMDIAHSFIKKYSPVALPLKAVKEGDVWLVDIDVGALAVKVAKVKVDAKTGDILSYEIPEKK